MAPDSGSKERARSLLPLLVLSALLFSYASIRAFVLPLTWDEAYSYLEFTRKGALSPYQFPPLAANNHFLNTWLTYLTTVLWGVSELSLRLPALAGHLLFLYYTARLSTELSSPLLRVSSFVLLNANPYILDFFSLSRGYALAYGLLAASLWYLYRFVSANLEPRYGLASLGCAILAVTAHLTLLHFLVVLLGVIVLTSMFGAPADSSWLRRLGHALRRNLVAIAVVGVFLGASLGVVRGLRGAGALYYGGSTSFWRDTIGSLVESSLYGKNYLPGLEPVAGAVSPALNAVSGAAAVLIVLVAIGASLKGVARHNHPRDRYLAALVFLLCLCSLASVGQHHLLGVPYLTGRTASYLLILFAFVLVTLCDAMARAGRMWVPASLSVAAVAAAMHLANTVNLHYVFDWKLAADVKAMVGDIAAARHDVPAGKFNTDVGVNLEFEAPLNYYRLVHNLTWLNVVTRRTKFHPLNDFYLYSVDDWRAVNADSFVVLKTYPLNGSRLVRRRVRPLRYEVNATQRQDFDGPVAFRGRSSGLTDEANRRSAGVSYRIDPAPAVPDRAMVTVKAMAWMESLRNTRAVLVVVFERNGKGYAWHHMTVRDGAVRPRSWFPVRLTCPVPVGVQQGDVVSAFLWNPGEPVRIDDMELRWITAVY